jgi:carbonic anhydrase/acetyltransferase-like protein (isoleucine patch superfamily)
MSIVRSVKGVWPTIPDSCWVGDNAVIVGDVLMGENCSVWFSAIIRGDVNKIVIGDRCNIQDAAVLHCTYMKAALTIGNDVSIGHSALVHGCTIHDHVLIGMGAIVMDDAVVEEYCIIAAGSVVLEGTHCESGYLYAGTPARKIKAITNEQRDLLNRLPENYQMYSSWFKAEE